MMCFLQKTNIMSIHLIDTDQDSMTKLIEFMELHHIKFELQQEKSPYDPEFLKKIEQSRKDKEAGIGTTISLEDLDAI
jgi:hypothetical protein